MFALLRGIAGASEVHHVGEVQRAPRAKRRCDRVVQRVVVGRRHLPVCRTVDGQYATASLQDPLQIESNVGRVGRCKKKKKKEEQKSRRTRKK
jgi:hypothetical protein